jgi:Stage II sporulation protein E (SpoIIE)
MNRRRETALWVIAGLVGALLCAWALPRFFPFVPDDWKVGRAGAEKIAIERLRDLGKFPRQPYVVVRLRSEMLLERRLQLSIDQIAPASVLASRLAPWILCWEVTVFPQGARVNDWTHSAWIGRDGQVLALRKRTVELDSDGEEEDRSDAVAPSDLEAIEEAGRLLHNEGYGRELFLPDPQIQRQDGEKIINTTVRMIYGEALLGPDYPYGLEVFLENGKAVGYEPFFDDPERSLLQNILGQNQLAGFVRVSLVFLLLPIVVLPFLRLYHEGVLGVRRAVQIFSVCLGAGLLYLVLDAQQISVGTSLGFLSRSLTTLMIAVFAFVFQFLGLAVLALCSWSVGEAFCRRRWPQRLASIDAFFRLRWRNATFARAAVRGLSGGLLISGCLLVLAIFLRRFDAWPVSGFVFSNQLDGPWPGLSRLLAAVITALPLLLFTGLMVPSWAIGRWGKLVGAIVTALGFLLVLQHLTVLPLQFSYAIWALVVIIPTLIFLTSDVFSTLLALFSSLVIVETLPLLGAQSVMIQSHGWIALLILFSPVIFSIGFVLDDQEFVYAYDDVPPHVRRIAERERQRVELETARRIQSSILPELPDSVNGVELAYEYLPATEVGGDFYDVLALDDGRIAVAVGDVAGHGVSSGLVMSMAKSALAVQVAWNPEVEAVFRTLNRMVYQSARQRLLSTLVYALVDPQRRQLVYASAGHVYPYLVSVDGRVRELASASYPLGVRAISDVKVKSQNFAAGDSLFLFSDGLVEACREGEDEPFGFDRLEQSLKRHAGKPARKMRDSVLADLRDYTRHSPQADDLTILVLRLPVE